MESQAELIERVVAEVLARVASQTPSVTADAGQVRLHSPLVTLESLRGKLESAKELVVPSRAVVTPAVRDLLREKDISLVRHDVASTETEPKRSGSLVLDGASTAVLATGETLEQALGTWSLQLSADVAEAVRSAIGHVADGRQWVAIFTERTAAAACFANRDQRVRAAVVMHAGQIQSFVDELDMNVLILNPVGKSSFELRRLLEQYTRADRSKTN